MVQSLSPNAYLVASHARSRTSGAATIAALATETGAGRVVALKVDGVTAANDRILTISGVGLASEAGALTSAVASARRGASLVQVAADALDTIALKLDRMQELAETISPATTPTSADGGATSYQGRAVLEAEFAALRSEVDAVAQSTEFDGAKILIGDGVGNALDLTYRVGSGTGSADDITVSIGSAQVADLSAGLSSAGLATAAAAAAAVTEVEAAIGQLDQIRGALRGAGQRFSSAIDNAIGIQAALEDTLGRRANVDVTIETVRVLAEQVMDEADVALPDIPAELFRHVLLGSGEGGDRAAWPKTATEPDRPGGDDATDPSP